MKLMMERAERSNRHIGTRALTLSAFAPSYLNRPEGYFQSALPASSRLAPSPLCRRAYHRCQRLLPEHGLTLVQRYEGGLQRDSLGSVPSYGGHASSTQAWGV